MGTPHIPLAVQFGKRAASAPGDPTLFRPQCSCGFYGRPVPYVTDPDPRTVLAREHGVSTPAGCAKCGAFTPPRRDEPVDERDAPWRRYDVIRVEGTWSYVCTDEQICEQRQRGDAISSVLTEADDPMQWADGQPSHLETTLDVSGESLHGATMREALAHYELAHNSSPRRWREISSSPADRRVLLALVSSSTALTAAAAAASWYYTLAARKTGATWDDLAAATGYQSGEECCARFTQEPVIDLDDVVDPLGSELLALTFPDP
ncbi:MAG: hypothetical protein JWN95_1139 [Frankiales bacterium]|nr:hypothetical protein [Frankiales bacterium]